MATVRIVARVKIVVPAHRAKVASATAKTVRAVRAKTVHKEN